jgi:superfamily II DNA or RNA helicase
VPSEAAAKRRLARLQANNAEEYKREINRRCVQIRRASLRTGEATVSSALHPHAQALIERLVSFGVGTVVLDECHHLLDYWAIVLRDLIGRIDAPHVVGLTATLPSPEDANEYENYTSLLGDVDFEVPTPAVVKEGDLAPYRDLVYFVEPTERENQYLSGVQHEFEKATAEVTASARFADWVAGQLQPREQAASADSTSGLLGAAFYMACLRFLMRAGQDLPAAIDAPIAAIGEMTVADWAALLERFGLDVLRVSPDAADHALMGRLRRILRDFGLTLTERGLRASRSPGDLTLTFSQSKDVAACEILAAEHAALGDRLRAVVVTDFERMSSGVRALEGVLDRDAGSALRVFARLVADQRTNTLDPILVTGSQVLADADASERLVEWFNNELKNEGLLARCSGRATADASIDELVGAGRGWSPRIYVALVTRAFEHGQTRCVVGTRGILGEGWDALTLNTLVDMTSVTTSASVQQLRGRTIRKDPNWPHKVAHNWDIICVAPSFERGDVDLRRFQRRHDQYWGIVPPRRGDDLLRDVGQALGDSIGLAAGTPGGGPTSAGRVVKGVSHVDPRLAYEMATRKFSDIDFRTCTERMLRAVTDREDIYAAWGIGEDYSNFTYTATRIESRDLKIRTVYTLADSLRRAIRAFRGTLLMGLLLTAWAVFRTSLSGLGGRAALIVLAAGLLGTLIYNAQAAYRIVRRVVVEEPPDAILLDIGRAVLDGLKQASLVSSNLTSDFVRAVEQPDSSYEVLLDYASAEDATTFINAFRDVFKPVTDQRYLIRRSDQRLPQIWLMPIWLLIRSWARSRNYKAAYHPVPSQLSTHRERAEAYARSWARHVGGGELIYTRSAEGRRVLLSARTQRAPRANSLAFEVWR